MRGRRRLPMRPAVVVFRLPRPVRSRAWSALASRPSWSRSRPSAPATLARQLARRARATGSGCQTHSVPGAGRIVGRRTAGFGAVAGGRRQYRGGSVASFDGRRADAGTGSRREFLRCCPRLLMNLADLDATGLLQVGSRMNYRLLLAGEPAAVAAFQRWLTPKLARGEQFGCRERAPGNPHCTRAGAAFSRFVRAADRGAGRGGGGTGSATLQPATPRCLRGDALPRRNPGPAVARAPDPVFLARPGCPPPSAVPSVSLPTMFSMPGWPACWPRRCRFLVAAGMAGGAVGMLLLFGFALPPVLRLRQVPTIRVLRREFGPPGTPLLGGGLGLLAMAAVMFWVADDRTLGAYVVAAFLLALLCFALFARGAIRLAARALRSGVGSAATAAGFGWRYGLANPGTGYRARQCAPGRGAGARVDGPAATDGDAWRPAGAWRQAMPAEAPDRFVIVSSRSGCGCATTFSRAGIAARLSPMVRGRSPASMAGRSALPTTKDRARRLVEQEFNLSWQASLPEGNTVVAGRWLPPTSCVGRSPRSGRAGARPGDTRWRYAGFHHRRRAGVGEGGRPAQSSVGLRCGSNFFVLTPPAVLPGLHWLITSFHLPTGREGR